MISNYFEKIYCINLLKDKDKLLYFDQQISQTKSINHYDIFIATDGYTLDLNSIDEKIITNSARDSILSQKQKTFGISLTFGSLGCALSHKTIFEECKYSKKPFLVFEDDIIIEKNFDNMFLAIIEQPIDYDIIFLGYNEIPGFSKKKIDSVLAKPSGLITGLYGYILSPSGAQNLLDTIFPLNKQIDSSISDNANKLKLYCSSTRIVGVTHKFGSKTQRDKSCQNMYKSKDDWDKLFKNT